MKKIVVLTISLILLTGCGKKSTEDLVNKFEKNVTNAKSYILKGNMEILSNEETYTYSLETKFLKENYYKVTLVNQTNNHEQIILRNGDGVFVISPSLNKSFKFQSEWPSNSSQVYILSSLLNDIKNDSEKSLEKIDKGYVIKTKVNYPNNKELSYQKIYFDESMNLEKVEVYNSSDIINIKATFSSINLKGGLDENDFALKELIDISKDNTQNNQKEENTNKGNKTDKNNSSNDNTTNKDNKSEENTNGETNENKTCENEECDTKSSNILDSIIYPLYIPSKTYLSNSEKIDTDDGNRVILTFAGEKNFVLIEEVANIANDFEVIPVYGDPVMLSDTIAAKSANSMYWTSDNISYYLTSSDLTTEEMVTIAESLGNTKSVANSK